MSLKGDCSFRPEISGVHQGSTTIRIGPRSKINAAKPFSTRRGRNKSLQEVSNLSGKKGCQGHLHIRLKTLCLLTKCLWPILNSQGVTWF